MWSPMRHATQVPCPGDSAGELSMMHTTHKYEFNLISAFECVMEVRVPTDRSKLLGMCCAC